MGGVLLRRDEMDVTLVGRLRSVTLGAMPTLPLLLEVSVEAGWCKPRGGEEWWMRGGEGCSGDESCGRGGGVMRLQEPPPGTYAPLPSAEGA
jgi:hypothetical protein